MEKLTAAVCECGQVFLPPKERCMICSAHTHPLEINDVGKIRTYTVLHAPPEGFDSPLILGLIELDDEKGKGHLRYPTLVCVGSLPEADLKIGLKVRVKKIGVKYFFGP